jgi:hypothetical protein
MEPIPEVVKNLSRLGHLADAAIKHHTPSFLS